MSLLLHLLVAECLHILKPFQRGWWMVNRMVIQNSVFEQLAISHPVTFPGCSMVTPHQVPGLGAVPYVGWNVIQTPHQPHHHHPYHSKHPHLSARSRSSTLAVTKIAWEVSCLFWWLVSTCVGPPDGSPNPPLTTAAMRCTMPWSIAMNCNALGSCFLWAEVGNADFHFPILRVLLSPGPFGFVMMAIQIPFLSPPL